MSDSLPKILIAPDFLTTYRYTIASIFFYKYLNEGYSPFIVAPTRTVNNLPFYCPDVCLRRSVISSAPVYFFKFYILSSNLLSCFFKNKPVRCLLWGEINRVDVWLLLIYKHLIDPSIKIAIWGHGLYGREHPIVLRIRILMANLADHIYLYDSHARERFIAHGLDPSKLTVVGNLIASEPYPPVAQLNQSKTALNLLYVGRLSSRKKIDLLIDVLKSDTLTFPIILTIVSPQYTHETEEHFSNNTIIRKPALYNLSDLHEVYTRSHFCICPDNVGLFAISSLIAGRCLITHLNYPYHGPEASCLSINNTVEIPWPVTHNALAETLHAAYKTVVSSLLPDPSYIRNTIPQYFTSQDFIEHAISASLKDA